MKQKRQMSHTTRNRESFRPFTRRTLQVVLPAVLLTVFLSGCGQNGKADSAAAGSFADALHERTTATAEPAASQPATLSEVAELATTPPPSSETKTDPAITSPSSSQTPATGAPQSTDPTRPTLPKTAETATSLPPSSTGSAGKAGSVDAAAKAQPTSATHSAAPASTTPPTRPANSIAATTSARPTNSVAPAPSLPSPSLSPAKKTAKTQGKEIPAIGWSDFFDNDKQDRPSEHFWDMSEQKQTVEIKGFMGEVLSFDKHWFLLIPKPGAECPFDNGDETYWNKIMIVFVPESTKLRYTSGPLKITGRLDVGIKIDESGYKTMFRLYDAKFEKISE